MLKQPVAIILNRESDEHLFADALTDCSTKQVYKGAVKALQGLEENPAHVIIIQSPLDDMSDIEIAEAIQEINADRQHFSYIIIVGKHPNAAVLNGIEACVDAFIPIDDQPEQLRMLAQQIKAGARMASTINDLTIETQNLQARCAVLEQNQLIDPLTGLGNRRFAEQTLSDSVRQIESRGGAVCFLMVSVENYSDVIAHYDQKMADQLILAVSKKIQQLVRPMDIVTYFEPGRFALVLIQPSIEQCTAQCYQRIYDGVNLKSYNTPVGYLPANIGMSICASEAHSGPPNIQVIIRTAQQNLDNAFESDKILVKHLTP
ncbi:MAG: diguanylate cyclase [SAR86 cluster bacterium]|jgi:diguanylate cyclase (GGDEF)-like protein|tara:strand:+ start:129 stop:1082 length:954 start_codon:yes stop_codon:yes gene_type:complete